MRILVLIHEFPPIGGGGGRVAQDICQGLVKQGHEVIILTAHLKGTPRDEVIDGVRVIRVRSLRRLAYKADMLAMGAFVVAGMACALGLIRSWKPDLIHVHFAVPAGAMAWALSRLTGIPYVLTVHLGDVPGGVPEKTSGWFRWVFPLTPPIWRDATKVIAVSEHTRQLALKHYPVEMQVIPNGVDLTTLNPGDICVGKPPQIIFAGRFVAQKNPVQLVRTLAGLQDLPWNCVMLGDGPLRYDVECEIKKHNLQDRFRLLGWVTPNDVTTWFSKSDVLFMSSLSEGLPVVGVQAMAMGLAIVASRVGGFLDIVEDGQNGYLYLPDDAQGMQAGLRHLLGDQQALLSARRQSRQMATRFDLSAVVDGYADILRQIEPSK